MRHRRNRRGRRGRSPGRRRWRPRHWRPGASCRAAWRAAKALGYRRLITYTQDGESGASLRGAGWHVIASRPPRAGWHTPSRPRAGHGNDHVPRLLWEAL
ncbi:XF1762 family protein [Streptomyces rochei]|uniref:XF1762 family protein n=1 Tax=Streptomyces rochei TaxID=1928 RepID=UPI003F4D65CA